MIESTELLQMFVNEQKHTNNWFGVVIVVERSTVISYIILRFGRTFLAHILDLFKFNSLH